MIHVVMWKRVNLSLQQQHIDLLNAISINNQMIVLRKKRIQAYRRKMLIEVNKRALADNNQNNIPVKKVEFKSVIAEYADAILDEDFDQDKIALIIDETLIDDEIYYNVDPLVELENIYNSEAKIELLENNLC